MRLPSLLLLMIVACRAPEPAEVPSPREPTTEEVARERARLDPHTAESEMTVVTGDPDAGPDMQAGSPAEVCLLRRRRLEEYQAELAIVEQTHANWVRGHCTSTIKHQTTRAVGGGEVSRGPERAWVCDGKIVDSTESVRAQWIVVRMATLRDFLREKCEK